MALSPSAIFTARPGAARRVPVHLRLVCAWNWLNGYEWAAADTAGANLTAFWTYYEEWTVRLENPTRPVLLPPSPPRRGRVFCYRSSAADSDGWVDAGCSGRQARPIEEMNAMTPTLLGIPDASFDWSAVVVPGADVNLGAHRRISVTPSLWTSPPAAESFVPRRAGP